jgi:hypothetical protein
MLVFDYIHAFGTVGRVQGRKEGRKEWNEGRKKHQKNAVSDSGSRELAIRWPPVVEKYIQTDVFLLMSVTKFGDA